MRVLRAEDFEKMAREVVDSYLNQSVPLDSGLAKTAMDEGLNPDQIQNLVQLANSIAHLTLFDGKNDGDKIVKFNPADPDVVLKKVYKDGVPELGGECEEEESVSESNPMDAANDFFGDFPDMSKKIRELTGSGEATPASIDAEGGATPARKSMVIIKIRKVAEELKDRELASAIEYKEELDKLASEFAKLYGPSYDDFEKDALAVRGNQAIPILCDVRSCLRMAPIQTAVLEKTARVVDSDTALMKSLDTLIKLSTRHQESREAYNYLKQKVGGAL